jgi:hypothetical protein
MAFFGTFFAPPTRQEEWTDLTAAEAAPKALQAADGVMAR